MRAFDPWAVTTFGIRAGVVMARMARSLSPLTSRRVTDGLEEVVSGSMHVASGSKQVARGRPLA